MDLLTQGVLGAALSQASRPDQRHMVVAGACGFLAGMAPDLDALIRSPSDPLIFLEYHRHFTHALAFIPFGGLISALLIHPLLKRYWHQGFLQTLLYCTLGYATHGLLDASTSYGTSLLWPFSEARIAWNFVSIIDPLMTVPLLALVVFAVVTRRPVYARFGLAWAVLYITLAAFQHNAALTMAREIAASRGHDPVRIDTKPSFSNIVVWRTIYEVSGVFYIDAVRAGISPRVFEGETVPRLNAARDLPWLDGTSQQAKDIDRFHFFSFGFIALDPNHPDRIVDVRYSFVPNTVNALWSVQVSPSAPPDAHVVYRTDRDNPRQGLATLWRMITSP